MVVAQRERCLLEGATLDGGEKGGNFLEGGQGGIRRVGGRLGALRNRTSRGSAIFVPDRRSARMNRL